MKRAAVAVLSAVAMTTVGCNAYSEPWSAERCAPMTPSTQVVRLLKEAAIGSDIVVSSLGEIARPSGCPNALANVQRADANLFLISLEVTPIDGRNGVTLRTHFVVNWEEFTEGASHDSRAKSIEQALVGLPGLDDASVLGRCSDTEQTCSYWVLTRDWLIEAQLLYLDRIADYPSKAGLGDELVIDFGRLLGEVMSTMESTG